MKNICHQNIQRHVNSLLPIAELYMTSIADVKKIGEQLNVLPAELENLQHQADLLNLESARDLTRDSESLQQTEFILDSLVDDLDRVSTSFAVFEHKLKNIMALKERLEALQEERIHGLTPDRIYKLLGKERELSSAKNVSTQKDSNFGWQKLINLKDKFDRRQLAISLAIATSLFLGWTGGYYASENGRQTNARAISTVEGTNSSLKDL